MNSRWRAERRRPSIWKLSTSLSSGLQTLGKPVEEARQLVVLLSSLPSEYEIITRPVENAKNVSLIEVKENLIKEYERLEKNGSSMEKAFRAVNAGRFNGDRGHSRKEKVPHKNGGGLRASALDVTKSVA